LFALDYAAGAGAKQIRAIVIPEQKKPARDDRAGETLLRQN